MKIQELKEQLCPSGALEAVVADRNPQPVAVLQVRTRVLSPLIVGGSVVGAAANTEVLEAMI